MGHKSDITRIKELIRSQFTKYARRFTREIAEEIQQAYVDTYNEFMDVYINWAHTTKNGADAEKSRFFLQASSAYWILGENQQIPVEKSPDNGNLKAGVEVDPKYIRTDIQSRWGENKGNPYDKSVVFDNMFRRGIMGYNWPMVQKSWYKSEESQRKYYNKYHLEGAENPNRMTILREIKKANIVPPTATKKPIKRMEQRYRKITTKKHMDDKWNSIVDELDKDIERLINKKR